MLLSEEQRAFVDARGERLLLEAPAGSGKTEVLAERVKALVEEGARPLLLCFTHMAQRTLQARLEAAGIEGVKVRTIMSLAYERVRNEYGDEFVVGTGDSLIREVCARTPVKPKQVRELDSLVLNNAPLPENISDNVVDVYEEYVAMKADRRYLSFADVVVAGTGLGVLHADEIVVDEAQDVTGTMLAFLESLEVPSLTFAGDSGQAIYGFTGVNADLFAELGAAGWTEVSLTRSYRVPEGVLPVVNAVRSTPLSSMRPGGSVRVVSASYEDMADALVPQLRAGDAVLGLTQGALERVSSRLEARRRDVGVSKSWRGEVLPGTVGFSTIHTAKGGEWKRVFLLDVNAQGFQSYHSVDEAEARRRFYVGSTRPTDELVLCAVDGELPWGMSL